MSMSKVTVAGGGAAASAGGRPKEGEHVRSKGVSDSHRVGQVGVLAQDDGSDMPFEVRFDDGEKHWYKACDLEKADGAANSNDEGATIAKSPDASYAHLWYCGRRLGAAAIPGSDGRCGTAAPPSAHPRRVLLL